MNEYEKQLILEIIRESDELRDKLDNGKIAPDNPVRVSVGRINSLAKRLQEHQKSP